MTQLLAPGQPGNPTVAVLVVDGNDARGALVAGLAAAQATVTRPAATNAVHHAVGDGPDCVLFAVEGAPGTRIESLDAIRTLHATGIPVIAYADRTATWPLGAQAQVLLAGAASLLDSAAADFRDELREHLTQSLAAALDARRDRQRIATAMKVVGAVGESEPMLGLFRLVLRVGELSDVPVLVHGETGTGKELVARALHLLDPKRRDGPFVAVNCSAINATVAESELFGHRRGAFTGAERDRKGFFRMADGGVLFLDEIGELDGDLQAKLLRVLQDHRVTGVGEDRDVPVDVRVIAATNRDLNEMASRRAFRADLLHRLNVVSIGVPTLGERRADIPALIDHFVAKHRDLGRAPRAERSPRATPAFLAALEAVAFPGNVRQLENLIQQILITRTTDAALELSDLPADVWRELSSGEHAVTAGPAPNDRVARGAEGDPAREASRILASHDWSLARSLEFYERSLLVAALAHADGNQSETARLLGVTARCVYNKIRKYGLAARTATR